METMGFNITNDKDRKALVAKVPYKYFDLLDMARDEGCIDRTFDKKADAVTFVNNLRNSALGRYNHQHRNDGFMICARRKADRVFLYRSDIDV